MRTDDALRALLDGKAISHESWKDREYLFLDNGILTKRTADSRYYPSEFVEAGPDKWRIVKKVIKFNSEFLFEFIDKNEEQILSIFSSHFSGFTRSEARGEDHIMLLKAILRQINEEYIIE